MRLHSNSLVKIHRHAVIVFCVGVLFALWFYYQHCFPMSSTFKWKLNPFFSLFHLWQEEIYYLSGHMPGLWGLQWHQPTLCRSPDWSHAYEVHAAHFVWSWRWSKIYEYQSIRPQYKQQSHFHFLFSSGFYYYCFIHTYYSYSYFTNFFQ